MDTAQDGQQLATQATQFANNNSFQVRPDDDVRNELSTLFRRSDPTTLACRVSTYVYENDLVGKEDSTYRIVFPSFASHWAIFVTLPEFPDEYGHIYHLTFRDYRAARITADKRISREVRFTGSTMHAKPDGAKEVGTTRFSHPQLMKIGEAMIKAFGDYHRVFWNCQHFARLYLDIITDGKGKFDEWTLGNTTNLFLCAFVVTVPAATTSKALETRRATAILEQFRDSTKPMDERDIVAASDAAIDLAQTLAEEDYRRNHPSPVKVRRPRGGVLDMIKEAITVILDALGLNAGKRRQE